MPPKKVLARGWIFEIESAVPGTWVQIGGISSFSPDRGKDSADTTDFDSGGWAKHLPAQRALTVSLEGQFLEDPITGARDAGQARVEVVGALVGTAGQVNFRMTSPAAAGKQRISGLCSVNYGGPGGATNDASEWGAEFEFDGAPVVTAV